MIFSNGYRLLSALSLVTNENSFLLLLEYTLLSFKIAIYGSQ